MSATPKLDELRRYRPDLADEYIASCRETEDDEYEATILAEQWAADKLYEWEQDAEEDLYDEHEGLNPPWWEQR